MSRHFIVRAILPVAAVLALLVGVRNYPFSRHEYEATGEESFARDSATVLPETVDKGRAVFHGAGTCFICHGQKLEGGVGPTLGAHVWKDAKGGDLPAIYGVVTHGVPNTAMAAHPGGISDGQAMQVATYVWAVSHDKAKP